jgi:hypothetical protein
VEEDEAGQGGGEEAEDQDREGDVVLERHGEGLY